MLYPSGVWGQGGGLPGSPHGTQQGLQDAAVVARQQMAESTKQLHPTENRKKKGGAGLGTSASCSRAAAAERRHQAIDPAHPPKPISAQDAKRQFVLQAAAAAPSSSSCCCCPFLLLLLLLPLPPPAAACLSLLLLLLLLLPAMGLPHSGHPGSPRRWRRCRTGAYRLPPASAASPCGPLPAPPRASASR